jgi:hypothetical protein
VVQGGTQIKGTVGEGFGIRDTGLLGVSHHIVDVIGVIRIVGGTGEVHTGPEGTIRIGS